MVKLFGCLGQIECVATQTFDGTNKVVDMN